MWGRYDRMSIKDQDGLTERERRLVDAYLGNPDLSVYEAAISAGFTEQSAKTEVYTLLRKPKIKRALDKEMAARARRTRVTKDRVLREVASVAFSSIDDYEIDEEGIPHLKDGADERAMKAVSSMKRTVTYDKDGTPKIITEIKLWDKGAAQEKLMRHLNLFKEDQEAGSGKVERLTDAELAERLEKAARTLKQSGNGENA